MKYKNTQHKLRVLWNENKTQEIDIIKQKDIYYQISKEIGQAESPIISFNILYKISDVWIDMNQAYTDEGEPLPGQYYYQWVVEFDDFPERLIPFIRYQIIHKYPCNPFSEYFDEYKMCFFEVEDKGQHTGLEDLKKVTMKLGWFVLQDYLTQFQAKLLIEVINPESYK